MARTNLHELATRLLERLTAQSDSGTFDGKLRSVAAEAGLNSVRSAEAVKLLEESGRIEVVQRGRRGRNTIIKILSEEPVTLQDAEAMLPSRTAKRPARLNYDELGHAVIDRLLTLARDDALRTAQVEAFASERDQLSDRVRELEEDLEGSKGRETELRIKLRTAEEALDRAEENLRRAFGPRNAGQASSAPVEDDDARAVLDILRSGRA
jgi:hypothetical protein